MPELINNQMNELFKRAINEDINYSWIFDRKKKLASSERLENADKKNKY